MRTHESNEQKEINIGRNTASDDILLRDNFSPPSLLQAPQGMVTHRPTRSGFPQSNVKSPSRG